MLVQSQLTRLPNGDLDVMPNLKLNPEEIGRKLQEEADATL